MGWSRWRARRSIVRATGTAHHIISFGWWAVCIACSAQFRVRRVWAWRTRPWCRGDSWITAVAGESVVGALRSAAEENSGDYQQHEPSADHDCRPVPAADAAVAIVRRPCQCIQPVHVALDREEEQEGRGRDPVPGLRKPPGHTGGDEPDRQRQGLELRIELAGAFVVTNADKARITVGDREDGTSQWPHTRPVAVGNPFPVLVEPVQLVETERAHRHDSQLGHRDGEKRRFGSHRFGRGDVGNDSCRRRVWVDAHVGPYSKRYTGVSRRRL